MKKIIISIMALFAISTGVMSQNALTVDDILLPQSDESTLTVNFHFDAADTYASYQFNLELPSDLEFVMKDGSETDAAFVAGSCNDGYTVTANMNEGLLKVAGLSGGDALKGTSGIFLQFTIRPKNNSLTIGQEYNCAIKDIVFATIGGDEVKFTDSNFKVTITQYTILDETSTVAPTAKSGVNVLVKRTIKADEWSTICLPFAMSEAQVKAAFGDDVQLGDFDGIESTADAEENITAIDVKFNAATAIEANHPYIIKVTSPVADFTADAVDVDPQDASVDKDENKVKIGGKWYYFYNRFIGTYIAETSVPDKNLFLNGNKFWYSKGLTKMKAFRAYFDFQDILTSVDDSEAPVFFSFNNDITGIKNIQQTAQDGKYYNLKGQRVESLKKGEIYINNGKKVVVK